MSPPAATRRKRRLTVNSDDEGVLACPGKQLKTDNAKLSLRDPRPSKLEIPRVEPLRPPLAVGKPRSRQRNGSGSITTFFSATSGDPRPAQRIHSRRGPADVVQTSLEDVEVEDIIEDASDHGGSERLMTTQDTARASLDRRRTANISDGTFSAPSNDDRLPNGSQNFKSFGKTKGHRGTMLTINDVDHRPWAERFAPFNLDELAVHKRKVCDVRGWLESVYSGEHRKRLLILKGPAGAGKTATLKMLAQAMKLDVSEWKNPVGSEYSLEGYTSMSANFEDFLDRAGRLNSLEFDSTQKQDHSPTPGVDAQGVVLLEEFPNTFLSTSAALQSFRASVLRYLAARTRCNISSFRDDQYSRIIPAIMIITETQLISTTALSDTFTVHRLLGSDILSHPAVSVIEFNPVAPTFIRKALDLVIQKEARHSGRRRVPGPLVLEKLAEFGDVRSAIGSLEFLCVRARDCDDWGGRVAANAKRGANAGRAMTRIEMDALEIVTRRENSLGLFHAVGKVVYNKRDDFAVAAAVNSTAEVPVQPPNHLQQHIRRRLPQTSVDRLMDETGSDADTFIAALHENYVTSCEGSAPIDALDGCLEALSDGDYLASSQHRRKGLPQAASYMATTESLRQEEIVFQLVVRGLLFALPDPVKRSSHPTGVPSRHGGRGDSHKMFYPVSMRLLRQMEEIEHMIDRWHNRIRTGTTLRNLSTRGASPLVKCNSGNGQGMDYKPQTQGSINKQEREPFRNNLHCTKAELILERLPYITKVEQACRSSGHLRELENITQFCGVEALRDDVSDDERSNEAAIFTTAPTALPAGMQRVGTGVQEEGLKEVMLVAQQAEKLYLSDDDIEDT